ncbi:hypothetical protein HU200_012445 [Digitaria exilis]|uniref:Cytochrome P450 n=1 Tax=Digitaria exilis TaxID=1010633 RepID=A0A835FEN4_9POAL|nr:hypothetical protein HU200_012445 [Digitaria exilis]
MERGASWLLWALAVLSLLYWLRSLTRRGPGRARLPPGPRPLPIIGNALDLRGANLHHALARLARVHGDVMRLQLGPSGAAVVVSSSRAAREAFASHDRRHAARRVPDAVRALGWGDRSMVWLPSSDPRWKALRGVVATHVVSPRSLAGVRGARERKVRELVAHFRARACREVEVGKPLYAAMLNLVSSSFFSVDVVDMDSSTESAAAHGIRHHVEEVADLMTKPNISDLFPLLQPLDLQGLRRKATGHLGEIFRILDGIIDRRLAGKDNDNHGDFLGALMDLMATGEISRDDVKTIGFDVLAAGSDTTAVTVEWAMALLLRNPGAMAKARAEIDGALGARESVTEHDVARLPYLQAVVKEAMRLRPVTPVLIPHQATEDGINIGGYDVPKGSVVIFNAWAIMRDPAAWEKPEEFMPERFLTGRAAEVDFKGKDYEFIPFGSGRRQCPGLPLAECVVPHVLASLLHALEWRLPDGVTAEELDVSERFTTANVMAVPLKAVPLVMTKLPV